MARRRRENSNRLLRRLLWLIVLLAVLIVVLARAIGDPFLSWAWPVFFLVPFLFWLLLSLLFIQRLLLRRRERLQVQSYATGQIVERSCAGTWNEIDFRPLLAVAVAPGYIHISIPPFILADAESLLIPFKEMRIIQVRRMRLAAAFRITFYNSIGRLEELTLYPRRPLRLLVALQQSGAPLNIAGDVPRWALVYPMLEFAWALFLVIWLML